MRRLTWVVGLLAALGLLLGASAPAVAGPGATLTVTRVTVNATWKESFLTKSRSVRFGGTVDAPAQLRAFIQRAGGGPVLVTKNFSVPAGAFNDLVLPLSPRPLPGAYTMRVLGTAGGAQLAPV